MTHKSYSASLVVLFIVGFQHVSISALPKPNDGIRRNRNSAVNFGIDSIRPIESIRFTEESPLVFRKSEKLQEACTKDQTLKRYDKNAKKCSQIGLKSHCGENMIFYSYNNSKIFGQCDCDYNSRVPLIYHKKTDRCYFIYQQGNCKEQEWLEINPKNGKPFCSSNKCFNYGRYAFGSLPLASRDTVPEYVPLNGKGECVKLNQPDEKCHKDEIVSFKWPSELYAKCNTRDVHLKHLSPGSSLQCQPGHYLSVFGTCQFAFDFD